jgi:predicted DNA-binding transcriptional regulator AlpA
MWSIGSMENDLAANWHLSERSDEGDLTRREYAELARVHLSTVKRWARDGIGPRPRKVGPKLVRYDRAEVLAFLCRDERRESA